MAGRTVRAAAVRDGGSSFAVPGEVKMVQSDAAAKSRAKRMAINAAGAFALSRSGDPFLGEFQPTVVLARGGETLTKRVGLLKEASQS